MTARDAIEWSVLVLTEDEGKTWYCEYRPLTHREAAGSLYGSRRTKGAPTPQAALDLLPGGVRDRGRINGPK